MRNSMMILTAVAALGLTGCGDGGSSSSAITPVTSGDEVHSVSSDGMPTVTKTMDFQVCLQAVQTMATDLGVAPINIVETTALRIVRFNTSDGSVLVTCSREDNKLVMVQSPHQG